MIFSKVGALSLNSIWSTELITNRHAGLRRHGGTVGKPYTFKVLLGLAFWRLKQITGTGTFLAIIRARGRVSVLTSTRCGFQSTISVYKDSIAFAFTSGGLRRLSALLAALTSFIRLLVAMALVTSGSVVSSWEFGRNGVKDTWNSSARACPSLGPAAMTS